MLKMCNGNKKSVAFVYTEHFVILDIGQKYLTNMSVKGKWPSWSHLKLLRGKSFQWTEKGEEDIFCWCTENIWNILKIFIVASIELRKKWRHIWCGGGGGAAPFAQTVIWNLLVQMHSAFKDAKRDCKSSFHEKTLKNMYIFVGDFYHQDMSESQQR